ncbi:MAG: hypothetical protein V1872_04525 [bacterium]
MFKNIYITTIIIFFLLSVPINLAIANPTVTARTDKKEYTKNSALNLDIEVVWEGEADEYLISAPELKLPQELEMLDQSTLSTSGADRHYLTYHYKIFASKVGDYKLESVKVKYRHKGEDEEHDLDIKEFNLKVVPFTILGLRMQWIALIALGLIIVIVILTFIFGSKKKKKAKEDLKREDEREKEGWLNELIECKRYKVSGEYDKFLEKVLILKEKFRRYEGFDELKEEIIDLQEKIRFANFKPSSIEIDKLYRDLELAIGKQFLENKDKGLEGIKWLER